jgi:DNA-binding NarL/FixJ family response regulator
MTAPTRILLAEGDAPIRAGLRLAVVDAGFEVVAETTTHAATVDAALTHRPDVALIAADLPGGGIESTRRLVDLLPAIRVIVLSADPGGEELVAAVLAGAAGYLAKGMSLARLPHAIRGVVEGEVALPRRHVQHLLEELRRRYILRVRVAARTNAVLTDREWEVLQLLGENASTAEIALQLQISQVTVRRHVSALLGKLGVGDRDSAAQLVRRSGD